MLMQVLWYTLNLHYLSNDSPSSLRFGVSVITSDDASYLASVENFLAGNGWRTNAVGDEGLVQRTPGYGLVYLMFRSWLAAPSAILSLVILQICLWTLAVAQLPRLILRFGFSEKISWVMAFFIGAFPAFSGFLGYTLTEGITPALVIFLISFLMEDRTRPLPLGALLGFVFLVRPALLPWLIPFVGILFFKGMKRSQLVAALVISLLPIGIWLGYTWSVTGQWQGLHPVYHTNATNLYRPIHGEIWSFEKMWGREGADFHRQMLSYWDAAELNETERRMLVEENINAFPESVVAELGKENLSEAYFKYTQVLVELKGKQMDRETGLEIELRETFREFKSDFVKANLFHSFIIVPAQVYGNLAFHSNLSLYLFQKPWRGLWIVEIFRVLSFVMHSLIFVLFLVVPVFNRKNRNLVLIWLACASYLVYLCFVQRGVEERYTLPYLVPMLILVAATINQICRRLIAIKGKS